MFENIDAKILRKAARKLHDKMGDLSDFPTEFCNSISNIFYSNEYILTHGDQAISSLMIPALRNGKSAQTYVINYLAIVNATVYNSTELAKTLNDPGISINDRNYFLQLTLDQIKYNIPRAPYKSLFRRTIERKFCRPFREHKDLWLRMKNLHS